MKPEDLRAIMKYLEERVRLADPGGRQVVFDEPTADEMVAAGLDSNGVRRILQQSWWQEMIEEVVETPDFCEPTDSPEQVLRYARDVVAEYIRKRFNPAGT